MGFFADPIDAGNRDMVALEDDRLSGMPVITISDWVADTTSEFPLPPVSLAGRADWMPKSRMMSIRLA